MKRASYASIVEPSAISRPLPWGTPSTTSKSTTSPSSFRPISSASVPPILPAPTRAIFLRAIQPPCKCHPRDTRYCVITLFVPQEQVGIDRKFQVSPQLRLSEIFLGLHLHQPRSRAAKIFSTKSGSKKPIGNIFGCEDQMHAP